MLQLGSFCRPSRMGQLPQYHQKDTTRKFLQTFQKGETTPVSPERHNSEVSADLPKGGNYPSITRKTQLGSFCRPSRRGKLPQYHQKDTTRKFLQTFQNGATTPVSPERHNSEVSADLPEGGKYPSIIRKTRLGSFCRPSRRGQLPKYHQKDTTRKFLQTFQKGANTQVSS